MVSLFLDLNVWQNWSSIHASQSVHAWIALKVKLILSICLAINYYLSKLSKWIFWTILTLYSCLIVAFNDALPSLGLNPLEGPTICSCGKVGLEGHSRLPTLKRGRGVPRSPGIRLGRWIRRSSTNLHPKPTTKRVSSHSGTPLGVGTSHGQLGLLDSPRPGFGGSHHLPPYSILCSSPPRLHPNGLFFQDSQVGVPKLSRVGVPGLWTAISLRPKLGSGQVLNQSCSSRRELSNAMLHSSRRRREEVDSRLLVVGSQTGSLTPGPSFAHNLGCRCPNGQCEAILDI